MSMNPKNTADTPSGPSHEEISERAYFIHLSEPGVEALDNWLRAERELAPDDSTEPPEPGA
jgi:hypothetical protein